MSAVADDLRKARALVEKGWTQRAMARDESRRRVNAVDPTACRWCAVGSVVSVTAARFDARYAKLIYAVKHAAGAAFTLASWNDAPCRTQAEVLAAFDRAIELAEQQP